MKNTKTQKTVKASKKNEAKKPAKQIKGLNMDHFYIIDTFNYNNCDFKLLGSINPIARSAVYTLASSKDNAMIKDSARIDDILNFLGMDNKEIMNTMYNESAIKRLNKGSYKINSLYFALLYVIAYRIERAEKECVNRDPEIVKLASKNYRKILRNFVSYNSFFSSMLEKDGLSDKLNNLVCDHTNKTITLSAK